MEEIDPLAEYLRFVIRLYSQPLFRIPTAEPLHERWRHILSRMHVSENQNTKPIAGIRGAHRSVGLIDYHRRDFGILSATLHGRGRKPRNADILFASPRHRRIFRDVGG